MIPQIINYHVEVQEVNDGRVHNYSYTNPDGKDWKILRLQ